ncbi:MAG: ChbG/HpnK family deacetylase [Verrucomicrobiota bacterium]
MIIINADDWGRSRAETDAALKCFRAKRITSVTAMMFMEDSERAAGLAKEWGIDAGLHLNLSQRFNGPGVPEEVRRSHDRVVRFILRSKYAVLFYHPLLRRDFRRVFQAQWDEFVRLYGRAPSHVDGHQHRHLSANVLLDRIIPAGEKVRRNFSFWPGEKGLVNRAYRRVLDNWMSRRYRLTDYFFSLGTCLQTGCLSRVADLGKTASVELMTHPVRQNELEYLSGDTWVITFGRHRMGSYRQL